MKLKKTLTQKNNESLLNSGRLISVKKLSQETLIYDNLIFKKIKKIGLPVYNISNAHYIEKKSTYRLTSISKNQKKRSLIAEFMLNYPDLDEEEVFSALGITMKKPEYFIFESKMNDL